MKIVVMIVKILIDILSYFISMLISFITSTITSISPESIITITLTITSILFLPSIIAYWFYKDFSRISRIITFISYLSNFNKDVKNKFSDYQTNLVFILQVVFIPFFLSLILYVIVKFFHDNFTNFTVLTLWVFLLFLLLFILLMYFVLKLLFTVLKILFLPLFRKSKVKVRELIHDKLPKNTDEKNKLKVKELIQGIFVFLISISFLITAEYSRVINELYYYVFIVLLPIVLFALSFYKLYNLVKKFVDDLNRDLVEQKIRPPKICIIAKNLRVEGKIVNLNLDKIEIIEKQGEKFKRWSIPWNKISDIFCVEVQKCS